VARVHEANLLVRHALVPDPAAGPRVVDGHVTGGLVADVRIVDGRITEVAPSLQHHGEELLDADGGCVLPGLHDHHLHLRALAAARRSVAVGPADVDGATGMARALRDASPDAHGFIRAVGYHESVAGELDRHALDAMAPGASVRVQHRSGALWVLNSAAVERLDLAHVSSPGVERDGDGQPTGRLYRMDAWLADHVPSDPAAADLTGVSAHLASLGVTGLTEATPGATAEGLAAFVDAVDGGTLLQRAHLMCPSGVHPPPHPLVTRGPEKFLLDDDRLPALDDFAGSIARAHAAGVPVAVHCVTAMQLVFAVTALEAAGPLRGDRIEHGAVVPRDLLPRLASAHVAVVVNPDFLFERGDAYLAEVEEREHPDLLRNASLQAAGIRVAAGTDAPFGGCDPWIAVAAAHHRRTRGGAPLGPDEALDETAALALFTGHPDDPARPRRVAAGEPGDLCVLEGDELPHPVADGRVAATVVGGRVVHPLS
jgi:predicted amidohydrolase YtcJ